VTVTAERRRASLACERLVPRAATGRSARYYSLICRQAGHRHRVRLAAEAAHRAARLGKAKATCARTWRPLEETCEDAAEAARAVLCSAAAGHRAGMVVKLTELHTTVAGLEELAPRYHDAAAEAGHLPAP
jgi:hypothetical protein